jgi:hypothetical protein
MRALLQAPTQMTWIERLREWLASELLQPLAHHIMTAHELNNQAMAAHAPNAKVRKPMIFSLLFSCLLAACVLSKTGVRPPQLPRLRCRPPLFLNVWASEPLCWCCHCPCFFPNEPLALWWVVQLCN